MAEPLGGTELMYNWLIENLPSDLLSKFQIICRPQEFDDTKIPILWVQDMPADLPFITEEQTRNLFNKIVFVSHWQQMVFNLNAGVPIDESVVIKNAIYPIKPEKIKDGKIRMIYHPTPHRGLEILVDVFEDLCNEFDNLELSVFSNFDLYARPEANQPFEDLYDRCRNHNKINYYGSKSNEEVRNAVAQADIFAYPSIWRETSCMAAMEAMSAKCVVVAPNYGALSETLANYNITYPWSSDKKEHAKRFKNKMKFAIESVSNNAIDSHLDKQKEYADYFYNKNDRITEWIDFLEGLYSAKSKSYPSRSLTWSPK